MLAKGKQTKGIGIESGRSGDVWYVCDSEMLLQEFD